MDLIQKFLPQTQIGGKIGYYPVCNAKEWNELPDVYKAMEWFPVRMRGRSYSGFDIEETAVPEYIEFDCTYIEPYKIRAKVKVHVQEFQKIMFCVFSDAQLHLYSVCGVYFSNGEYRGAKWVQDSRTGAFAVISCGTYVGKQGGFANFIPERIEETEEGFRYKSVGSTKNRCHYEYGNPFYSNLFWRS